MSADGPGSREVAHRLFAAEFDDADLSYSESDEERAPNYVVTPTGARINRLFLVGVLTEVEQVNEEMLRARVVDPTGAFVVYAGQYQPDALAFLERTDPPAFLAVTGKARTFQPEDSDRVFTSVRPESISRVDAETRDLWVVQAAERTLERVGTMAAAIASGLTGDALRAALEADGVDPSLASGIPLALDHYGTTPDYLAAVHDLAVQALETVASEREEVEGFAVSPADGAGDASALATKELSAPADVAPGGEEPAATEPSPEPDADATTPTEDGDTAPAADTSSSVPDDSETEASTDVGDAEETDTVETSTEDESTDASGEEPDSATTSDAAADDPGEFEPDEAFDPDEEVLSDEERAEAEELGGFSTGNEVEESAESGDAAASDVDETAAAEPETADVDAAAAEDEPTDGAEEPESEAAAGAEPVDESATEAVSEPESESEADDDAGDVSLEESVMDAMTELDDGDGAEHDAIVETVVERTGADPDAVDEAIQDALMSGQCYEPDDGVFKPI